MKTLTNETELCKLFHKYGADKCPSIYHSYSPEYSKILEQKRNQVKYFLEIGVGNKQLMTQIVGNQYCPGASLRAWRDFFPHGQIFGLDIDKSVLFEEDRIKCFYVDQSSTQSLSDVVLDIENFTGEKNIKFDVILDDGSHIKEHMVLSYASLNKYLKNDGIYIIEDIQRKDLQDFINLSANGMEMHFTYQGFDEWDNFVAYKKTQ